MKNILLPVSMIAAVLLFISFMYLGGKSVGEANKITKMKEFVDEVEYIQLPPIDQPQANFEFKVNDIVFIDFDIFVSLCIIDSDNRAQDSIDIRNKMIENFDATKPIRAKVLERYYVEQYETAYYVVCVYDKLGEKVYPTKIVSKTSPESKTTNFRFTAINERFLKRSPLTI